jgi:hypothetical protein
LVFGEVYERAGKWLAQPSLALWLKARLIFDDKGPKLVVDDIAPLVNAVQPWPARLEVRLQASLATREQLLGLKEVLSRHRGPVPALLHFLDPKAGEAVLALPPEMGLTPSDRLVAEVNGYLGYLALSL